MTSIERLGILGAGRAGTALARAACAAGIAVQLAGTRTPAQMKYHLAQYSPQATAVTAEDVARGVDLVVLMVPQEELDDVDPEIVTNTVLLDATNRWQDEPLPEWFERGLQSGLSSSEVVAARFARSRVVKALNHLSHWDLDADRSAKAGSQRALAVASDDATAARLAASLIQRLGFEPVVLDSLAAGRCLEPEGPIFNEVLDAATLWRLAG